MGLVVLVSLARAADLSEEPCPTGTELIEGTSCRLCISEDGASGTAWFDSGSTQYKMSYEHGRSTRFEVLDSSGSEVRHADVSTGSQTSLRICEHAVPVPAPDREGLLWLDSSGLAAERILRYGGRGQFLQHTIYRDGGENDTFGVRDGPAYRAHARGHWSDGYYHRREVGPWRMTAPDGSVETGHWARGEPVGDWRVVRSDGVTVEEGVYKAGYPHGQWTCVEQDGTTFVGVYSKGLRVGVWTRTDAEGNVISADNIVPAEASVPLRGRGYRGGILVTVALPSPCAADPNAADRSRWP